MDSVRLICPNCKGRLVENDKSILECGRCSKDWSIDDGVPVLTDFSTWYPKEHMTVEQFEKFLIEIDNHGWDIALDNAIASMEKPITFNALAFNESMRNLSSFLPVHKEAVVLDYGCGVGGISFNLARSCKTVVSIDQSRFRTKFINARSRCTGVLNIKAICTGNTKYLPFPGNSFDIIVLNGVLEWMPLSVEGDPYTIQLRALKEMNRVLKKGGVLYLSIENRFGYRYVIHRKGDSHNQKKKKIKYITVLPRFLANIYSYIKIQAPDSCYLYSLSGYEALLQKSKFEKIEFYFPYPDHNHLDYMIPLKDHKSISLLTKQMTDGLSLSKKERTTLSFLAKMRLLKYLAQDYSITAVKN